jgi:hypothetical protein
MSTLPENGTIILSGSVFDCRQRFADSKGLPAPNRDNLPAKEFSRGLVSHECQIQWHDSDMPRKALHRGLKTATWTFRFAAPAYNLVRMRKLLRLEPHELRYYELTPA